MYGIEILLFCVLVAFAQGTNSSLFPNRQSSWIVGGIAANAQEFPSMVCLRRTTDDQHFCGGSIISKRYVLTAAHCIDGKEKSSIVVVVGTYTLRFPGQRHIVSVMITHPLYKTSPLIHNIGLIKVINNIVFSPTVRPLTLETRSSKIAPDGKCVFMGWGYTSPSAATYPYNLQKRLFKIIYKKVCLRAYPHAADIYICASPGPGYGTCHGDEGGPLLCNGKQVGVYSGSGTPGSKCSTDYVHLFSSVPYYMKWINFVTSTNLIN